MNIAKTLIQKHGLRREDIASKLGCSWKSVDNWVKGMKPVPPYQVKLEELFKEVKAKNGKKVA